MRSNDTCTRRTTRHSRTLTQMPASPRLSLCNPTRTALALPPPLGGPIPHQTLPADAIVLAHQIGDIDVQRAVEARITQQLLDRAHDAAERVAGRPVLARQQREADLAGRKVHVRVADGRDELHGRRGQRVVGRDGQGEQPEAAGVGRGLVARAFEHGFPVVQV